MKRFLSSLAPFAAGALFLVATFSVAPVAAQFQFQESREAPAHGPRLGTPLTQTVRTGFILTPQGIMQDVTATVPIPMEWPEQKILGISEEGSSGAKIKYRPVGDAAREVVFTIDKTRSVRPIELLVTIEMENYDLLPPEDTENYVIPKKTPRGMEHYLKPSPSIDSNESRFRKMFLDITKDRATDWDKVEAIYSYVQTNVKYDDATRARTERGALAVVSDPEGTWYGDCKDMCCLFIALCRAGKIPARIVRVPEHCYAEFYLELKDGVAEPPVGNPGASKNDRRANSPTGYWFPCQVAGTYAFGGVPERRPILHKGDSYPDREKKYRKARRLFLVECAEGDPMTSPPPQIKFVREVLPKE